MNKTVVDKCLHLHKHTKKILYKSDHCKKNTRCHICGDHQHSGTVFKKTKQKNYYLTRFYKLHLLYFVMPQLISRAIRFKKDDFSNLSREEFPLLLQLSPPLQREIAQNMNKSRLYNL